MDNADLHIHTYYSDGTKSPEEIIKLVKQKGIKTIAISDHDCMIGAKKTISLAKKYKIKIVPAIEFSCEYKGRDIHMLGYFMDFNNKELKKYLNNIMKDSEYRVAKRIEKVNKKFGTQLSIKDARKHGKGLLSQPHVALAMIDNKLVKDYWEAIRGHLIRGKDCFVESKMNIDYKKIIEVIKKAGGIPVLAHPYGFVYFDNVFTTRKEQLELFDDMRIAGVEGLELYIYRLTKEDKEFCEKYCKKYKLFITGGSDYHGERREDTHPLGGNTTPFTTVKEMEKFSKIRKKTQIK